MTTRPAEMTLVDHHGRKYLTADERQRFFAAVRTHRRPTVQTLAHSVHPRTVALRAEQRFGGSAIEFRSR